MFRRLLLCATVLAGLVLAGTASIAEAGGCYRGGYGGGYGGGYYPAYRSARFYGGPSYYRGPSVYRRSYYGAYPAYYRGGYRSGVTLSFGW